MKQYREVNNACCENKDNKSKVIKIISIIIIALNIKIIYKSQQLNSTCNYLKSSHSSNNQFKFSGILTMGMVKFYQ